MGYLEGLNLLKIRLRPYCLHQICTKKMKFKDYWKLTKTTSKYCLRISGVSFTVCFIIIYLITDAMSDPFHRVLLMAALFIILGNLFAVFIWLLAILPPYRRTKRLFQLIKELPKSVVDKYNISILMETRDGRYNYPKSQVVGYKDDMSIVLDCDNYHVYIKLFNSLGNVSEESYIRKEWRQITLIEFDKQISRLLESAK